MAFEDPSTTGSRTGRRRAPDTSSSHDPDYETGDVDGARRPRERLDDKGTLNDQPDRYRDRRRVCRDGVRFHEVIPRIGYPAPFNGERGYGRSDVAGEQPH